MTAATSRASLPSSVVWWMFIVMLMVLDIVIMFLKSPASVLTAGTWAPITCIGAASAVVVRVMLVHQVRALLCLLFLCLLPSCSSPLLLHSSVDVSAFSTGVGRLPESDMCSVTCNVRIGGACSVRPYVHICHPLTPPPPFGRPSENPQSCHPSFSTMATLQACQTTCCM